MAKTLPTKAQLLAQAIGRYEGYYKPKSLSQRQYNPGNLRFAGQVGAVRGEKGFAKFATEQAGWDALHRQIAIDAKRGHTVQTFMYKYAPPTSNNTPAYAKYVQQQLRVPLTTKLSAL
jgi:hypothetical protein